MRKPAQLITQRTMLRQTLVLTVTAVLLLAVAVHGKIHHRSTDQFCWPQPQPQVLINSFHSNIYIYIIHSPARNRRWPNSERSAPSMERSHRKRQWCRHRTVSVPDLDGPFRSASLRRFDYRTAIDCDRCALRPWLDSSCHQHSGWITIARKRRHCHSGDTCHWAWGLQCPVRHEQRHRIAGAGQCVDL